MVKLAENSKEYEAAIRLTKKEARELFEDLVEVSGWPTSKSQEILFSLGFFAGVCRALTKDE